MPRTKPSWRWTPVESVERAGEVGDRADAQRREVLDGLAHAVVVVGHDGGQAVVVGGPVDEHDRPAAGGELLRAAGARGCAVAVMKPSTWRARSASKLSRSRSGSLSVLASSDV